ncbi:MAG: hypothetical protein M1814_003998 [Vezdaea aestivalis]|nr:MAG: hypothetical protein M1814_003998 [Vezdaea aestivalis]
MESSRKKSRKRKRHGSNGENPSMKKALDVGLGAVKALLAGQSPTAPRPAEETSTSADPDHQTDGDPSAAPEDWTVVDRKSKKKKHNSYSSEYPSIVFAKPSALKAQLKLGQIQELILYIFGDGKAPYWVAINNANQIRKMVVLMVPGLERQMIESPMLEDQPSEEGEIELAPDYKTSPDHYFPVKLEKERLPEPMRPLADMFPLLWPVRTPGDDRQHRVENPVSRMLHVPLSEAQDKRKQQNALNHQNKSWKCEPVPVTALIASPEILRETDFVMHPALSNNAQETSLEERRREDKKQTAADGWVDSEVLNLQYAEVPEAEIEQGSVTRGRDVYAVDCEMCETTTGELELTRISMIDWDGTVAMDELVKPTNAITNYLTPYSGITKEMLEPVTTTLSDIQTRLKAILHAKAILIGHSVNADLGALKFTHPFIIDTSIIYPHPRGPPLRSSLKYLTQRYLSREIQKGDGATGHDSIEDALGCLDLVKLKCEKGLLWGTAEATLETVFKRIGRTNRPVNQTNSAGSVQRSSAVVDWGHPERVYASTAKLCIGCKADSEVVDGISKAINGDSDGELVSDGGVDFVWARFRELETFRGWRERERLGIVGDGAHKGSLRKVAAQTLHHIGQVYGSLPPCTAFVVYSGGNDPREMDRLHALKRQFTQEFRTKKWDELSVKWTDDEEQALKKAALAMRQGLAFITVK